MIQLYAFNPEGKQDVATYPEPLVKYLAELQVRIKKQEGALEVLDVRLLNTEIDSRELQSKRTKISQYLSTLKEVYKELYAILQQSIPVIPDIPVGLSDASLDAAFILCELYPTDCSLVNEDKTFNAKPLADYLDNLKCRIKQRQDEMEALDVRIANSETDSSDLQWRRSRLSRDITLKNEIYDDLCQFLRSKLDEHPVDGSTDHK